MAHTASAVLKMFRKDAVAKTATAVMSNAANVSRNSNNPLHARAMPSGDSRPSST